MIENDYKYAVEDFIELIFKGHDEVAKDLPSRLLRKSIGNVLRNIEHVVEDFTQDFERELEFHKEYISKLMAHLFSERYWYKFEEGHDIEDGFQMICYFEKEDRYEIGLSVRELKGGITFEFKDGSKGDPDYIGILPRFKKEDKCK